MTTSDPDFDFSDEPAESVSDDDPAVTAGLLRRPAAQRRDAAVPEGRFGVDRNKAGK